MNLETLSLDIRTLLDGYRTSRFSPEAILQEVVRRCGRAPERHVWIERFPFAQLQPYLARLRDQSPETLPLYGIPFAIKDNIDLAGVPTTAACPDYAYTPGEHAFVVRLLVEAGAIPLGKTNLDQFATGLVGTRSPYGACRNPFDPDTISGGSSSGSAVAVASGLASFALGTDTAGSGRVPAAFNHIVGLKPTRGLLSNTGVVPACRSLDCVAIFTLCCEDAQRVFEVCAIFDHRDAYTRQPPIAPPSFDTSRFRFGVSRPEQLAFFGNEEAERLFAQAIERLQVLGGQKVEVDFAPFLAAARLLYQGPWVAERYAAIEEFIKTRPDSLLDVTRSIIAAGPAATAVDAFKAQYELMDLRRQAEAVWAQVDCLLTPTAGTIYRIDEVAADPVRLNSNLGYYTNFMNLLDLSAVALPAGFQADGLPFGVTLFAPAFADRTLMALADRLHPSVTDIAGATGLPLPPPMPGQTMAGTVPIAVCGAHLSGLPLNHQLTDRGAWLLQRTRTAAAYRLYALPGGPPQRPGLVRNNDGGSMEVEVWALPSDQIGSFLQLIPTPLGLGQVELEDGRWVCGFICEPYGIDGAEDVTAWGGWRNYLASLESVGDK